MVTHDFFQQVLVLTDTEAAAFRFYLEDFIPTQLDRGRRFDTVTAFQEADDVACFHDVQTGLIFVCPSDRVLLLNNRFRRPK